MPTDRKQEQGQGQQPPADGFLEVRDNAGRLLFRYDPLRDLVEIRSRGSTELVDLRRFRLSTKNPQS